MELLTITLAANETKQFAKAGRYFEIIDSTAAITVIFTGSNGAQSDSMVNAVSGLFLEDPYSHFSITNGNAAQSITLLLMEIGRGGSRRQPGNVRIIDEITEAITYTSVNLSGAVTAGMVHQPIILPALNVSGIIIRAFSLGASAGSGGVVSMHLTAAKTLPTGYALPAQKFLFGGFSTPVSGSTGLADSKMNKLIPRGFGMYVGTQIDTVTAVGVNYNLQYEIL